MLDILLIKINKQFDLFYLTSFYLKICLTLYFIFKVLVRNSAAYTLLKI